MRAAPRVLVPLQTRGDLSAMHDIPLLRDLVILVAAAIPVVVLANRMKIPTVVGFLLTGVAIGPHGLALVSQPESVQSLAEVGVVLLLFTIGLELSLSRVARMGRSVLRGGAAQVLLTIAAVAGLLMLWGLRLNFAVFAGSLVALSSTAVILKLYSERGELDSTHGRVVVAILIFQDLCVVPLMLLVPILAGAQSGPMAAVRSVLVSTAVVAALVFGGRLWVPKVLERIAALRNREIFTLAVVFTCVAAAWITSLAGLSLALGAFLAGLVLSESEYGLQALSDVLPFRDTFSGLFFTSLGMLLDVRVLLDRPFVILGAALTIIVLKSLIMVGVIRWLKRSLRVGVIAGLGLAQVGEFSFVLAGTGLTLGLATEAQFQVFLGASVLTMLLAPLLVAIAEPVADRVTRALRPREMVLPTQEMRSVQQLQDHVIIVGWGLNGRNLARALATAGVPYVILETNGIAVRRARLERQPIFFGDGTHAEVLAKAGIERARVVVFVIASANEERRGVAVARQLNPHCRIVVRTRYVSEIEELLRLGADEVVPEELETSVEVFARVLRRYGVSSRHIRRLVGEARMDHYGIFRSGQRPSKRISETLTTLGGGVLVETAVVDEGARAVGETVASLQLRRATGATLVAIIRDEATLHGPDGETRFEPGDEVVLIGAADQIERALALFHAADTVLARAVLPPAESTPAPR
jgi:CPA2 family monovalent cation:H+ antiporter-2